VGRDEIQPCSTNHRDGSRRDDKNSFLDIIDLESNSSNLQFDTSHVVTYFARLPETLTISRSPTESTVLRSWSPVAIFNPHLLL